MRIDQVLHGYDRGHKEIASSLRLDEKARATMLVHSDLLADNGSGGSYLTCYPLPSASRHILARTWSAGAGSRPGSVWTHSLVLDYQCLAKLNDLVALEPLLMRSGDPRQAAIAKPLEVPADLEGSTLNDLGAHSADAILRLYGTGETEVTVEVPSAGRATDEFLALALWRQMWPGLRRTFSFATGLAAGRPGAGPDWTLRFAAAASQGARPDLGPGLHALLDDLPRRGPTELRLFLSRYASEATDPRRAADPLAALWSDPDAPLRDRLRMLGGVGATRLTRLTRDLVSQELSTAEDPNALIALVEELGDQPLDVDPTRAVPIADDMDLKSFARLLAIAGSSAPDQMGRRIFEAVVRGSEPGRLSKAAGATNRECMLALRPELIDRIDFWPADDAGRAALIDRQPAALGLQDGLALFSASIGPLTARSLLAGDPDAPAPVVVSMLSFKDVAVAHVAAQQLLAQPEQLGEALASLEHQGVLDRLAEVQIANGPPPPAAPAWCACVARLGTEAAAASTLVVCHVAAMDLGGRAGLETARSTFDPLMRLAMRNRLSREQEAYLERAISGRRLNGWRLADRLAEAALDRWPPEPGGAGAIALSEDHEHARALVNSAVTILTRSDLKLAMLARDLPHTTGSLIRRKLDTPVWLSWWS